MYYVTCSLFLTYRSYWFSSAIPILSLVEFEYSNTCSDDYLVDREDFIVLEIASTENSSINRNKNACTGPQFFCTKKTKNNIINVSLKWFLKKYIFQCVHLPSTLFFACCYLFRNLSSRFCLLFLVMFWHIRLM